MLNSGLVSDPTLKHDPVLTGANSIINAPNSLIKKTCNQHELREISHIITIPNG